jgi:lipopolysaccharide export system protein LptA
MAVLIGLAAGATLVLAQSQNFYFRDRAGNMKLSNMPSWRASVDRSNPNRYTFRGRATTGTVLGEWDAQNMTIRAKQIEGSSRRVGNKMELENAELTGGVTVTMTRPSARRGATQRQTVTTKADSMDLNGNTNTLTMKGGVTMTQDDPGAESSMTATGATGVAVLTDAEDKNAKGPVQSANLSGNAKITVNSARTVTEGGQRRKVQYQIVSTASRVQFQLLKTGQDYGTITLTGNVVIAGNDPILFGEMRGYDRVVITLDSEMQPVDIEAGEGRGTTTVTQKGRGRP